MRPWLAMNGANWPGYVGGIYDDAAGQDSHSWKDMRLRGVIGANTAVTVAQIIDGTSNTILLGEVRAGVAEFDSRGVWALGDSSTSLWGHGSFMGDANGPNAAAQPGGDNTYSCDDLVRAYGGAAWNNCPGLDAINMTCYPLADNQQSVKSMHEGGAFVCLADGSVHWISDFIDTNGNWSATPVHLSVWDRLNLSADGALLSAESF